MCSISSLGDLAIHIIFTNICYNHLSFIFINNGKKNLPVYIFGGRTGVDMSETAMNDMWKLQLSDGDGTPKAVWTEIKQVGDIPEARSFHKMITIGTSLYLFGGVGKDGRLNDLWKFDTTNDKWTSLGSSILESPR